MTNQRVLVLADAHSQSIFLSQLPPIVQSRADGSGSLEFGSAGSPFGYGVWANTGMDVFSLGRMALAFYDIHDVTHVYCLINQARTRSP